MNRPDAFPAGETPRVGFEAGEAAARTMGYPEL